MQGTIRLEDYPVTFDNEFHFTILVSDLIRVVEVRGTDVEPRTPFSRLFDSPAFGYEGFTEDELRQEAFDEAQMIILNELTDLSSGLIGLVNDKLTDGASILIVLPSSPSSSSTSPWGGFLQGLLCCA